MSATEIKDAIRAVRKAKEKLGAIVERTFPVGTEIQWERCGHRQSGLVMHHGDSGNVRVENGRTLKKYWISMYNVVGYVE